MTDLERWIEARRPAPPPSLRDAILDALVAGDPGAGPVADRLAAAGLAALARVAAAPSSRPGAIRLLAADALITYACEATVEEEAEGGSRAVQRLTRELGLARFAEIFQRAEAG